MRVFEHCDELGNAVGIGVIAQHVGGEADKLARVEAPAVRVEMVEELFGGDVGVETGVAEVPIPHFFDCLTDEFGGGPLGSLVRSVIANKDGMFGFAACTDHGGGVVCDGGGRQVDGQEW